MKLLLRVLLLLTVPFMLRVLAACSIDGCEDAGIYQYSHKSFEVSAIDNSGSQPVVVTSGEVVERAFGIRLSVDRDQIASIFQHSDFSFFTPLSATDCEPAHYIAEDSIVTLKVYTVEDFDAEHGAGSDVSEYFRFFHHSYYVALDDYIGVFGAETIINTGDLEKEIDLLLMTVPELNTTHQFKVQVVLSDGRVFEETTPTIDLVE